MRAVARGLVACCLLVASSDASAATEWVVLRVERVEVAVAHADGTPWDEGKDPGVDCSSGSDLLTSPNWSPVVKGFCSTPGTDSKAPDLGLRVNVEHGDYVSPIAKNTLSYHFGYDLLVPLVEIPADGLAIEVFDQDENDPRSGEVLGSVRVKVADIRDLLESAGRVKTFSNDSVTRLEVSTRRYARAQPRTVKVNGARRVSRLAGSVIAGELVELRATKGASFLTVVMGGVLDRLITNRCMVVLVQTSGPAAAGLDDNDRPTSRRVTLKVLEPSLSQWVRGRGWRDCSGGDRTPRSLVTIGSIIGSSQTSLAPSAIQSIVATRYREGIQRCHERALAHDAMLVGRGTVMFTVGPTGAVVKVLSNTIDPALDACIESIARKWRFSAPKDPSGGPTTADFDAPLSLDVR